LDAGTFATMGVGCGFAVAAALLSQDSSQHERVVCIQGDSAFGFSGMEFETACRCKENNFQIIYSTLCNLLPLWVLCNQVD